ncbi:MAG: Holliday junction branch migration protein RuvA [Candidatus Geothermincolia bacterium]
MIDSVRGKLRENGPEGAVIEVGGLGLRLHLSTTSSHALPAVGEEASLLSYLHVKEDILQLYGFASPEERSLFTKLITVSGVGPRLALTVLSAYSPDRFAAIVATADLDAVTAISGIGRKTGQRLLLELKEKLAPLAPEAGMPLGGFGAAIAEAREALKNLGYSPAEAAAALEGHEPEQGEARVEEIIRYALSRLGGSD